MKIAYVYDAVYPWVKGGAEKRIYEISRRLAARGHEVHCYGMKWWQGQDDIEAEGVHLHGICPPRPLYSNGKRSISQAAYFAGRLLSIRTNADVLDCQNFPYLSCFSAKLISRLQGPQLFITWLEVWGEYWREYLGEKGRAGQAVEWAAARLTDRNIAISKRTQRDLLSLAGREAQIVPPGIDCKMISEIAPAVQQSDLIYVGRLIEHKNIDLLIRSLKHVQSQVPDVKVLIVGDGPEMNNLRSLAKELDLSQSIRFLGFIEDYNYALSLMKSSRIFVSPSTREGFGMAALEANACGIPVVTVSHDMNAVMDLIGKDTGLICQPNEVELSQAILSLLRQSISGNRCIEAARQYDWDAICNRAERVYEQTSQSS
ncbi:MAG TPA: glycosyltransferase family 4 protein [Methanothrix sp.]|nr:glycosyltransferase family 4 protein [Methanothrix sp.]HQE96843.1 glycosyltransferase family 4 protein [Methanothrix sp.]